MAKFRIYLEVSANAGLCQDASGKPCETGVSFGFSVPDHWELEYWETARKFNLDKIAEDFLFGAVNGDDLKVISPEEYSEKYGDEEDDQW